MTFNALLLLISLSLPSFADTLIFGGTRGVGLETVRQLAASGEAVTVLVTFLTLVAFLV